MEHPRLRHRIEYTRNKHSRAIYRGNTIIIRLAKNLSRTEEHDHIQSLLRRMTQIVLQEKRKVHVDPFRPLLNGAQSLTVKLATGKRVRFTLMPGSRTASKRTADGWKVTVGPSLRRKAFHRYLWSLLAATEAARLERLVHDLNDDTFRALVSKVTVRFATTQWGSCSPRGVIMLNTALLFLPASVLKYVIIHELAHRRVPNHSAAFWRELEKMMPGYEKQYRELQEYRLPSL
jgi:predicted metal-dependent hydrolase